MNMTIPMQNALEARRQHLHDRMNEEAAKIVHRTTGVPGMMVERLIKLALEVGALNQVCEEHDVTNQVLTRGDMIQ